MPQVLPSLIRKKIERFFHFFFWCFEETGTLSTVLACCHGYSCVIRLWSSIAAHPPTFEANWKFCVRTTFKEGICIYTSTAALFFNYEMFQLLRKCSVFARSNCHDPQPPLPVYNTGKRGAIYIDDIIFAGDVTADSRNLKRFTQERFHSPFCFVAHSRKRCSCLKYKPCGS